MQFPQRQLLPEEYPALLNEIPEKDYPAHVYIRGVLPAPHTTYLCVVGSRATSPYGRRICNQLIRGLAGYPVAIVSGMALGIDAEAHKAALEAGLPTVAVLPSSLDEQSIYPSTNKALASRILESGGCLMSEYLEPHRAAIYDFPKRNRIAAGMSKASLIVEAGEKSGTLITARLALDYNREVLCVPHELGKETGAGVNRLIREGATLIRNSDDMVEALGFVPLDTPVQQALPTDLTQQEAAILEVLVAAAEKDSLIEETGLSAQDANVALSSLLLRGLIAERLGKIERL